MMGVPQRERELLSRSCSVHRARRSERPVGAGRPVMQAEWVSCGV